jgi:hypothetical protein
LRPARRLSGGGAAAHLGPSSKSTLERTCGYFLRVVSDSGALNMGAAVGAHVSTEAIKNFISERSAAGSVSIASGVAKV